MEDNCQTRGHPTKNAALERDKGKLVRDEVLIAFCRFQTLLKGRRKKEECGVHEIISSQHN